MDRYKFLPLLSRILIGAPFLMSGLSKLGAYAATVAFITAVGMPVPPLAFIVAVVIEVGGGLSLLLGYRTRLVAFVLAVFAVVAAIYFHHDFGDQNQMIHFMKNLMITGGLLQITYFGAGMFSLDARVGRSKSPEAPLSAH
ncbi:DoxX family protein [Paraburkholderia elongata]|uniref:DoxX family membrane protein n=1 Tax=Paraburkholderia elongata TaxID=2675747 RepID=A0A972NP17_9BURK|nr:DoxX family protein [Paraburkholderia elongata]NPT55070.1 DoxX family membrane protein [Paraburkholderia elongata]